MASLRRTAAVFRDHHGDGKLVYHEEARWRKRQCSQTSVQAGFFIVVSACFLLPSCPNFCTSFRFSPPGPSPASFASSRNIGGLPRCTSGVEGFTQNSKMENVFHFRIGTKPRVPRRVYYAVPSGPKLDRQTDAVIALEASQLCFPHITLGDAPMYVRYRGVCAARGKLLPSSARSKLKTLGPAFFIIHFHSSQRLQAVESPVIRPRVTLS